MKYSAGLLLCALLAAAAGCNRTEPPAPPVATPTVTFNKEKAAIGSPLKITYKFDVAQNASFDADYVVFVHVLNPDGDRMWQDDHSPVVPTSQWKPGQTIEYTRTVFVPPYPHLGEATIRLGLYNPANGKRLSLNASDAGLHEYVVGKLNVLPVSENIFLIPKDGWHPAEVAADDSHTEWQWTQKVAKLSFRNPKRDATFYLDIDVRTDLFNPPQQVTLKVGGQPVATFAADNKERTLRTFPITAAQFGAAEMAEITIEVDRTFSGPGSDTRELGIRVYHAFIE